MLDRAFHIDDTEQKRPLYPCGTFAPGHVHDPCQHSVLVVRCCSCAGCTMDEWFCGFRVEPDSYPWWEAQKIAARWDPWVRHPYALVLYALVLIFLLSSQIVFDLLQIFWTISVLSVAGVLLVVSILIR